MLRYIDDSVLAVANSLAFAYRFRPDDVLETLTLWNSECKERRPNRINKAEVTSREALLATVALTYGKIECDKSIGTLTPLVAVQYLKIILLEELHPRVREIALFAIGCQAERAFDQVEPELQDLVSRQITQKERQEVAEILTEIYLKQRFELLGGDQTIEIDNKQYQVWLRLNSTRPLTTVEQAMVHWVKNKQNPMAQQVATNAAANFASKLEQEEERQIKQLREGRDSLKTTSITVYADPIEVGKPPQDWYFGKLIAWLATRDAESYRTAIHNLLPEGLRQYKKSQEVMNFVLLQKWGTASDAEVRAISKKLKSGLWWAENLVWFVAFGIGGVLTLVGVAAINISNSPKQTIIVDTRQQIENSSVNNPTTPVTSPLPAKDDKTTNATLVGESGSKNIRSGPGTEHDVRHIAYPGDRLRVIGKSNDRGGYLWYNIYFPQSGAEGWIGAHLVQVDAGVQP